MAYDGHCRASNHDVPPIGLTIDFEALRPLITQVVEETLARVEAARATLPDRLAFSEPEAARLLGLAPHQLRDERLRGRISASRIVGRQVRYLREDLLRYLMAGREETVSGRART
jgi:hypothetical protein